MQSGSLPQVQVERAGPSLMKVAMDRPSGASNWKDRPLYGGLSVTRYAQDAAPSLPTSSPSNGFVGGSVFHSQLRALGSEALRLRRLSGSLAMTLRLLRGAWGHCSAGVTAPVEPRFFGQIDPVSIFS